MPGRNSSYRHYGKKPSSPPGGWQSEEASNKNPAYVFLSNALRTGAIDPHGDHHQIYNTNSALYGINPSRFLRFFRKAVTNTLDINLEELSTSGSYSNSTSSSTLLFPSTASTETSTHQEARSKMDDESYISRTSTSIRGGSSQPRLPSRPLRIGTDRDGFPTSATPISTESGPHRQIDLDVSIITTGPHNGTLYIQDPPSSLNEGNLMFRPSEDDPKTAMIIWEKGNHTFVQKVTDALTGGGHEITYVCDGQRLAQPLLLDRSDAHVVGLGDVARRARGQGGNISSLPSQLSRSNTSSFQTYVTLCITLVHYPLSYLSQIHLHSSLIAFVCPKLCSFLL